MIKTEIKLIKNLTEADWKNMCATRWGWIHEFLETNSNADATKIAERS